MSNASEKFKANSDEFHNYITVTATMTMPIYWCTPKLVQTGCFTYMCYTQVIHYSVPIPDCSKKVILFSW